MSCKYQSWCKGKRVFNGPYKDQEEEALKDYLYDNPWHGKKLLCCHNCGFHGEKWNGKPLVNPRKDLRLCDPCIWALKFNNAQIPNQLNFLVNLNFLANVDRIALDLLRLLRLFEIQNNKTQNH